MKQLCTKYEVRSMKYFVHFIYVHTTMYFVHMYGNTWKYLPISLILKWLVSVSSTYNPTWNYLSLSIN